MDNKIDKVFAACTKKERHKFLSYHFLGFYQFTDHLFPYLIKHSKMNASSLMDSIFLLHTFLSVVVAQWVSMLTMLFHLLLPTMHGAKVSMIWA
jgi:hypothetical protein